MELALPLKVPGIMLEGNRQQNVSLYAYALTFTCAFISVMDREQYQSAEKILFENLFVNSYWRNEFAMDTFCFIGR